MIWHVYASEAITTIIHQFIHHPKVCACLLIIFLNSLPLPPPSFSDSHTSPFYLFSLPSMLWASVRVSFLCIAVFCWSAVPPFVHSLLDGHWCCFQLLNWLTFFREYIYIYIYKFSHKQNIKHEIIPVINQSLGQYLACIGVQQLCDERVRCLLANLKANEENKASKPK